MSTLATRDLTIRFGGHVAVNAVTCAFEPGTLTAIVGPNGAGKTTYFNLISGQLKASAGRVISNGGGWQSENIDPTTPELAELFAAVAKVWREGGGAVAAKTTDRAAGAITAAEVPRPRATPTLTATDPETPSGCEATVTYDGVVLRCSDAAPSALRAINEALRAHERLLDVRRRPVHVEHHALADAIAERERLGPEGGLVVHHRGAEARAGAAREAVPADRALVGAHDLVVGHRRRRVDRGRVPQHPVDVDARRCEILGKANVLLQRFLHLLMIERVGRRINEAAAIGERHAAPFLQHF